MKVDIRETNGIFVALLSGRLDSNQSTFFADEIQSLFNHSGEQIVIDCEGLEYICSLGLRILLRLNKDCAAHDGHLQLRNLNNDIQGIFELTGFVKLFDIVH